MAPVEVEGVAEAQPELDVVLGAVLLVPEVLQQKLSGPWIGAAVVQPAQEGRVCTLEVVVLGGISS